MHLLRRLTSLALFSSLLVGLFAAAPAQSSSYAALLQHAQAAAAEKSWAAARADYERMLPLAPDEKTKQWVQLWLVDATWRAEDTPNDWQARQRWKETHTKAYAELLLPYPEGAARDERFAAILTSRAALHLRLRDNFETANDQLEAADTLAGFSPTPEAKVRYLAFIRQLVSDFPGANRTVLVQRLIDHVERAAQLTDDQPERAWFALQAAQLSAENREVQPAIRAARWAAALQACQGTPFETQVKAHEFVSRIETGYDRHANPNTPVDLPARLAEARGLLTALKADATDKVVIKPLEEKLRKLERAWTEPWLRVHIPKFLRPGQPLQLAYGATGYSQLTARLYRHTLSSWIGKKEDTLRYFRTERRDGMEVRREDFSDLAEKLHHGAAQPVRTAKQALPNSHTLAWQTGELAISPAIKPGFYSLEVIATDGNREDVVLLDVVVTSLQALVAVASTGRATLHVYHAGDDRPVTNKVFQAAIFANETHTDWQGRLSAEGMIDIPLPTQGDSPWKIADMAALVGDQPLVVDNLRYGHYYSALVADLILDRELYRPGETVYWKLVVREFVDGKFAIAAPKEPLQLSFQLMDAPGIESPPAVPVRLNAFGTAHGSFVLPATVQPGFVNIELMDSKKDGVGLFNSSFRIDNYTRPPVQARIQLVSAPDSLRVGAEITVRVQVDYYSGGPVVAAPVTFTCEPGLLEVDQDKTGSWERSQREQWRDQLKQKTFTGITDAKGGAEFRIMLPGFIPSGTNLNLDASVSPAGSPVTATEADWSVTDAGFLVAVDAWTDAKAGLPGDSVSFTCHVVDGRGLPAAFQGTASLVELRWSEAWLNPAGEVIADAPLQIARRQLKLKADENLPEPWKRLHADYSRTVVAKKPVQTDASGLVQVSFTPKQAGVYQLQLKAATHSDALKLTGDFYSPQSLPLTIIAADETTIALPISPGLRVIAPDQAVAGQPQKFLGILPEGTSTGLFAMAGSEGFVTQRVAFRDRVGWITVEQPPPQASQSRAWLMSLENGVMGDVSFSVLDPAQRLSLTLQPSALSASPGSEATISLAVRDAASHPASAEVAISVSDEAVNTLTARADRTPGFWRYIANRAPGPSRHPQTDNSLVGYTLSDPRPSMQFILSTVTFYDEGVTTLSPFEVSTEKDYGYLRTNSATATRIASKIPMAISVVSREFASITLRRFFSSTAAWEPALTTDAKGQAQFNFRYPDNLTRWRIEAYAVGRDGNSFGQASTFTQTSLPFQARLQIPRFLTAGDIADLSAVFVNRTDAAQSVEAQLTAEGAVRLMAGESSGRNDLTAPTQGETRASWKTEATTPGDAQLTLKARSAVESDGMSIDLPVQPDGFWQQAAASARLAGDAKTQTLDFDLPTPLDPACAQVEVRFSPGVYPALLNALPYLIDYPYGCTEQTMNRFLPAVVVCKALVDFGLDAADVEKRLLSTESPFSAARRKKSAGLTKLDDVVQAGLARLAEAQLYNGSFGWWPGQGGSDPWMTAYVIWGLNLAAEAGVSVPTELKDRTVKILCESASESSFDHNTRAWMLVALSRSKLSGDLLKLAKAGFATTYAARDRLSAHGRACLALAGATFGSSDERKILLRNLENGALRSTAAGLGDTVHWGSTSDYWRATDGAVESTALTLLALIELDPTHPLTEPAVNWLMLNRRSSGWTNTRDTAFAVLALSAHAKTNQQHAPADELEIHANGRLVGGFKATPESVFASTLTMPLMVEDLRPGKNHLELRRQGGSTTIYALALTSAWAENATVKPSGHLVQATRDYERLQETATLAGTLRLVPMPLATDGNAAAGEKVTAIVTLTLPNDLEYLMIEVPKPAGCEPFNPLSGWDTYLTSLAAKPAANSDEPLGRLIYREEHDDRSVFFLDRVSAGTWEIRFALRAITPGDYRAAPVKVEAMYAPEIRANTEARRVKITPRATE